VKISILSAIRARTNRLLTTTPLSFSSRAYYILFALLLAHATSTLAVDLRKASVLVSPSIPSPMKETAPTVLIEEIHKRSNITLKSVSSWPKSPAAVIVLALDSDLEVSGTVVTPRSGLPQIAAEGYQIVSEIVDGRTIIWVRGADSRGILFGVGWLLRNMSITPGHVQLRDGVAVSSSPTYPIRGHQLGYRHTANTYDAWSVAQYDQYIRELALFGSNGVEGIPFDDSNSPHFKIPAAEMNVRMSEICEKYDQDYWVWTPATFDLTDQVKRANELKAHEELYKACPRLDHIFFPGGDPGHNHPSEVLPFLKELQTLLVKHHPKAKMWISLQGFNVEQIDYFFNYLETQKPTWLQGVVTGPGSPPMAETRFRLPKNYQHRHYPDITHSVRCEFPVEQFDQAFALTLGRESVNPRPFAFAKIHKKLAPFTDGFVSYSDGSHDDVNKVVWSMLGWDPNLSAHEIMVDYARFFFGDNLRETAANGIEALEQNWKGPLEENGGVQATFDYWKKLEAENPKLKTDWRWQMLLQRAYYDQYTRLRLIREQKLEKQANVLLRNVTPANVTSTMEAALKLVNEPDLVPVDVEIRKHLDYLADALFTSVGLQSSTAKHQPRGPERGVVMDFVDYPLNNRWWLQDEFEKIKKLPTPEEQVTALKAIADWESPGPGSYYDDVSHIGKGARVKTFSDDATDIAWWDGGLSRRRLSAQTFQGQPALDYENLDPKARYIIRVVGYGEALLRVDGQRLAPTRYEKTIDGVKEWIVPLQLSGDGKIAVTFDKPEESDLNWRNYSKISDIWLLKQ
jgi:hypothetical protein